jgi:quinol monooxygenase YgiN
MAETMLIVDIAIKPGKVDDFKAAAQALFERTQDEPGTLRYDYFISDDGTRNINIEVFEDAAAFVAHNQNCAPLVPALVAAGDILRIDVVGDHSDELYAELEGLKLLHFTKLGGITR